MLAAFAIVVLAFWFGTLGMRSLIGPDEGRYASLSLGMLNSGDWITPRLNGLLYFEKPAMQYWLGALIFKLFGVSEFTARLWPALAGLLTVLCTGFTATRLWGRDTGIRALAITASMTWIVGNSHYLTLDAGLTFFLTLCLCAVLLAHAPAQAAPRRRAWIWLAWTAMAGAVLSKGLVGIAIPGAALVLLCLWQRDAAWWRGMHWGSGLLIFLLLCAPWFVLISLRQPAFADFFFIHEHFARFLTPGHQREGAWWYFIPLLLGGALPWTGALPWLGRATTPASATTATATAPADTERAQRRVLIAWSAFTFVFFSVSDSKLPSYILPMFPALALLTAMQLRRCTARTLAWHLLVPALLWLGLLVLATQVHRLVGPFTPREAVAPIAAALRVGAAIFLAGAGFAWWSLRQGRITNAVLAVALAHVVAMLLVMQSHDGFGQLKSADRMARALAPYIDGTTPVFAVRDYDQTMPFYLHRNVVLVDYVDEFALGERLEPGKSLATLADFEARWRALPRAAAALSFPAWKELDERHVPMRIVFHDTRRVVVVKP